MIEYAWGKDVVTIVKTLSKVPKEGYLKRFHISTDWRPYVIKGCDRLYNLRTLEKTSVAFQTKQIAETRDHYYKLFDRMVILTPPEYKDRVQNLRDMILMTTEGHVIREPAVS